MSTTGVPRIETHPRAGSALRCALCHDGLDAVGARTCPGCGTVTHAACADEARTCPTLGCRLRAAAPPADRRFGLVALGALTVPMGGVLGLTLGSLCTPHSVQDALREGVFLREGALLLAALGVGGGVLGFLTSVIDREATRCQARSTGRRVVALLLACACVGGALLGFAATFQSPYDDTSGPFR